MADLQELFARLKAQSSSDSGSHSQSSAPQQQQEQPSIWAQPQQTIYQQPSVSSPLFSPPINAPNPARASDVISPAPQEQQRTNNLLNLLKFNNAAGQGSSKSGPMASLHNIGEGGSAQKPGMPKTASSSNQQDFLLNLLRKPNAAKPVQPVAPEDTAVPSIEPDDASIDRLAQSFADATVKGPSPATAARAERSPTPARLFGSNASRETTPFDAPQPTKAGMFTYINPFDQLNASSPLNATPRPEAQAATKKMEILKHDRDVSTASNGDGAAPAAKTRKLGADTAPKSQSVSEALGDVGEKVNKQAEEALAQASEPVKSAAAVTGDGTAGNQPVSKNELAEDEIESSWESAEDSANDKKAKGQVKVYNLPMKPFVTINVNGEGHTPLPIRQDDFMVIAQLKKVFDQMDRSLVTASQNYIVYAQNATRKDNAGFRIIRQDTGDHKQVFRSSGERVFTVQLCSSAAPGSDLETVLGTGVNGTVFWSSLAKSRPELFAEDDVEAQGFMMPAVATPEENTSGSPVKTRAKCSSRTPELFAISRSKTIYIVAPDTVKEKEYCNSTTRVVNSEKYFAEHGLRINTGKAGKDFTFSEDDTVIASLDKSGVVKFWDIRELADRAKDVSQNKHAPIELRDPLWTLHAAASGSKADEKPSVSSVMLLDKERPHTKAVALRYMLVGFKQNHILQLWDLGLGKAVQELRLPHDKDSDGFCSINYHPKTGIIAIGHPTRNSVYFIHLSAPKYTLPVMDQTRYISLLARADTTILPKPESTAIMSGLRESSFAKVGLLRSLDMLKTPVENAAEKGSVDETLFELYVEHSKGVVGVPIKRADLGWDAHNKMVEPVDAVEAGVVTVTAFETPSAKEVAPVSETASVASAAVEPPSKKKEAKKQDAKPAAPAAPAWVVESMTRQGAPPPAPAANGAQRSEAGAGSERRSKQIPEAPTPSEPAINTQLMTPALYATAAQPIKSPKQERAAVPDTQTAKTAVAPTQTEQAPAAAPPAHTNAESNASLSKQFDSLYQRLDADKRIFEAAGAARQDAMLRLVSSTLTENVEQSLHRIIGASIEKDVIPALADTSSKILDRKLAELLPKHVDTGVQRELKAALPNALTAALRDQQVHRTISEATSNHLAQKVQQQVSNLLQQSLPNMAMQATQKMVADLETRTNQRLQEAETQREEANQKVDQLAMLVRSLSQTIQGMADSQTAFQEQILRLQKERGGADQARADHHRPASSRGDASAVAGSAVSEPPPKTAEEMEVEKITSLLVAGEYEQATIEWLQSPSQAALFDNLFVRVNPADLQQVTPLVALSVSAALTASLDSNISQRLEWLDTVLRLIDVRDPEIADVAPKIMDVLGQRLQGAYMVVAEQRGDGVGMGVDEREGVLRKISALNRKVGEVRRATY
ncbi:hypothetical protein LTR29_016351 [Friedmanniomyces endolithicus]|nr:hypothetical protein LTR29_016351 [Friedmanniomyces endolithicus]